MTALMRREMKAPEEKGAGLKESYASASPCFHEVADEVTRDLKSLKSPRWESWAGSTGIDNIYNVKFGLLQLGSIGI